MEFGLDMNGLSMPVNDSHWRTLHRSEASPDSSAAIGVKSHPCVPVRRPYHGPTQTILCGSFTYAVSHTALGPSRSPHPAGVPGPQVAHLYGLVKLHAWDNSPHHVSRDQFRAGGLAGREERDALDPLARMPFGQVGEVQELP